MKPEIKICGITSVTEAKWLIEEAVQYAGVVLFYEKSKRNVIPVEAEKILQVFKNQKNCTVKTVAVVVSPTLEQVQCIESMGFDILQVHKTLSKEVEEQCKLPIIRAFQMGEKSETKKGDAVSYFAKLWDAREPGSGTTFDWNEVDRNRQEGSLLILAGGLSEANVAKAIAVVNPDVVDVSSGVETESKTESGFKDREKIRAFVKAVAQRKE